MADDADDPVGQGDWTVERGDSIASIADLTGHFWQTIWNDPANEALKERRENPETLLPGDKVTIPPLRQKTESRETDLIHPFKRKGVPVKVVFTVAEQGPDGKVFADKAYTLQVGKRRYAGRTDQNGYLEHWVTPAAKNGKLVVDLDEDGYPPQFTWELGIGTLAPAATKTGAIDRLKNLGYGDFSADGNDEDSAALAVALKKFQADIGIDISGELDEPTIDALESAHDG